MLLDVIVITQKLGSISEAGKNLTSLQMLVKDKPLPRKNVGQTMAGLLKRNGSKKDDSVTGPADDKDAGVEDQDKDKEGGDGDDEDGENLGILPPDDETKEDSRIDPTETPATESKKVEPPALPEKSDASSTEKAPTTPRKDPNPIQSSIEAEIKVPQATAQEESVAEEVLTAPPTSKDELPVLPVAPLDAETDKSVTQPPAENGTPPPSLDTIEPVAVDEEEKPDLPAKA
jgi:vacuolar protein sorting-associated protein 54